MPNERETKLLEQTSTLKDLYVKLNAIVDRNIETNDCSIEKISEQIQQIRAAESVLGPMRDQYQKSGRQLSPQLKSLTDDTIELVKALMPKMAQLEKMTLDAAKRLFPEIHESVRVVQMQSAYGARQ